MARKMYEEAVTILKEDDCYKVISTLDRLITEYETFRSSNKMQKDCLRFLESLVAGFKIMRIASKLQRKMIKVEEMDLKDLKQLTIEAYKCEEFPVILIYSVDMLCAEFALDKYLRISRVFMMVSVGAHAMVETRKNLSKNNFSKFHLETELTLKRKHCVVLLGFQDWQSWKITLKLRKEMRKK